MCVSQNKQLISIQQQIRFVYVTLSKIWAALNTENEASTGSENEGILGEFLSFFDQQNHISEARCEQIL